MTNPAVNSRDGWILAVVLCLALTVRCALAFIKAEQLTIDRDAYLGIAENLAQGNGFSTPGSTSPTAFRPPLYPLLLSAVMSVLPTGAAVALIHILAGGLTVYLVDRLGRNLGLGRERSLAAIGIAIDPLLLNATVQPMTEVVFTALTTAWLAAVTRPVAEVEKAAWRHSAVTGLWFGLAALCRPTIWPLAGLLGLWWGLKRWKTPSAGRRGIDKNASSIFATIAAVLVVSPWVIRNQLVFGAPILMTTHGGYTLLLGNNPTYYDEVVRQQWGTTWSGDSLSRWQAEQDREVLQALGSQPGEVATDAWMSAKAKRYLCQHPGHGLQAMIHRVRCLWNIVPQGEGAAQPAMVRNGVAVFYAVEYLAALAGLWMIFRRSQWMQWLPCLLLIVAIQGVHLAYWTDARMRTPLQPVVALLAARAMSSLLRHPSLQRESVAAN